MIHYQDDTVTIHHGDCLDVVATLPDNSVDAICTDPPYELAFMGRQWDASGIAFNADLWRHCLRVLKPGGHILAFGGTRTWHRLAAAIEDAGFEIRDSIAWIYGCLSDDTEALTRHGWVRGTELCDDDEVLQWDSETGALSWTRPQRIVRKHWRGEMVRLSNRHTDQLVTPDHRIYARIQRHSRHAKATEYEVSRADALRPSWIVDLPLAGHLTDGEFVDPDFAYLVGWWLTDAWRHKDGKAVMFSQSKPGTLDKLRKALAPYSPSEYTKEPKRENHNVEHTFYVSGELAEKLIAGWPARDLGGEVLGWSADARRRLAEGLIDGDGSRRPACHGFTFWSQNAERRDIVTALLLSLGWRAYDDPEQGAVYANPRGSTQLQKRHRDAAQPVNYDGLVWCVTVPSGAFVARRNGRPFITGNSGFPKSLDVSKAIDRAAGAEREVVGVHHRHGGGSEISGSMAGPLGTASELPLTAPATDAAKQWAGWGTALKPAFEPIIVARKPLAGTVAANVLAHGTGALNIDACRIEAHDSQLAEKYASVQNAGARVNAVYGKDARDRAGAAPHDAGRWPTNVVLDEHQAAELDTQSGYSKSTATEGVKRYGRSGGIMGNVGALRDGRPEGHNDAGGASRFFPTFRYTRQEREQRVTRLIDQAHMIIDRAWEIHGEGKMLAAACVLFSGGNDSTVLAHMVRHRVNHAVHVNTTIGIEQTRQFVRDTCAAWQLDLIERKPPVSYRELVLDQGFPGPAMHFKMYQRLKERALRQVRSELVTYPRRERVLFIAGRRRSESARRVKVPLYERDGSVVWASPLAMWTKLDMNTYRLMCGDVPVNEVSELLHMSGECLCGSFAKPGELDEIRLWFPDVADEIAALEREVAAAGHPERLCTWGYRKGVNGQKAAASTGALCSSCDQMWFDLTGGGD